jgi:hypothetical protein
VCGGRKIKRLLGRDFRCEGEREREREREGSIESESREAVEVSN